jgi:hypothetical protein
MHLSDKRWEGISCSCSRALDSGVHGLSSSACVCLTNCFLIMRVFVCASWLGNNNCLITWWNIKLDMSKFFLILVVESSKFYCLLKNCLRKENIINGINFAIHWIRINGWASWMDPRVWRSRRAWWSDLGWHTITDWMQQWQWCWILVSWILKLNIPICCKSTVKKSVAIKFWKKKD